MAPLTAEQLADISIIERACSVISLLGSLFVIVTFCLSRSFHKPVNRLVFYATFGNMLTNVGTLMSRTYVNSPDSVGCQFQAFLIQMYVGTPSHRICFHHGTDTSQLYETILELITDLPQVYAC